MKTYNSKEKLQTQSIKHPCRFAPLRLSGMFTLGSPLTQSIYAGKRSNEKAPYSESI